MDCITVLAQAYETSSAQASDAVVPIDTFWKYITSLNAVEAVTFISFGVVCLCYGWRVFKVLVVISFALLGLFLGVSISNQIVGLNSQLFGGLIGMLVLGILSVPLIKWSVCILGAAAGGIMSSGVWYACGLTERYIMAGALIGIIAGGMISFIIFKIAVMLFSSLGGSTLMVVGVLALLHLYPSTKVGVEEMVFTRKWFLPLTLMVPTVVGLIMQNRFVKDSKDWDI
jgi:hypothetical protein